MSLTQACYTLDKTSNTLSPYSSHNYVEYELAAENESVIQYESQEKICLHAYNQLFHL